jgi:hypothetical protein
MDQKISEADVVIKGAPPAIVFEVLEVLAITLDENESGGSENITLEDLIINGVIKVALIPVLTLFFYGVFPY